jgi:hypothetical protein
MSVIEHNFASESAPAQPPGRVQEQMMELGDDLLFHGTRFTVPVKGAA